MKTTIATLTLLCLVPACDALLGPLPRDDEILEGPIEGLSGPQLVTFILGDKAFGEHFAPETGLGPVYNAPSCESCHPGDGKGHPANNLTRFGRGDFLDAAAFDYLPGLGGAQLQDRAIPGYLPEVLPAGVQVSVRSGPVVVGLGLIEAIPPHAILAHADPEDRDGDGISGRPNFVLPPDFMEVPAACECEGCRMSPEGCRMLGRFGRKATSIDLLQQTVGAYHADMGLTTEQISKDVYNPLVGGPSGDVVPDPEVPQSTVSSVVFYLRTLRTPVRRHAENEEVLRGERLFSEIGCQKCHVPEMRSGQSPIEALRDKKVALYSDLLLHDMGEALADYYPEGSASGLEWRTTPLWGLGITPALLGGAEFYLHDGRARTLEEAIRLHGGEAQASSERFRSLSSPDREALLSFLRSL